MYLHVIMHASNNKVLLFMEIFEYTNEEMQLYCSWTDKCKNIKQKLFCNNQDIRCFKCIPWGNLHQQYNRIGKLLYEVHSL